MDPAKDENAASTWVLSVTSVEAMKTSIPGNLSSIEALVSRRGCSRRPRRAIRDAPATAKDLAVSAPIPVPPPVIRMALPFAESSGRLGEMDG